MGCRDQGALSNMLSAGLKKLGGLKKVILRDIGGLDEVGKKRAKALVDEVLGRDGVLVGIKSIC
jgi:hypothetical protein